jgi:hypothetical protein
MRASADSTITIIPGPFPPTIPSLQADETSIDYYYHMAGTGWWTGDPEYFIGGAVLQVTEDTYRHKTGGSTESHEKALNGDSGEQVPWGICAGDPYLWNVGYMCTDGNCQNWAIPPGHGGYGTIGPDPGPGAWFDYHDGEPGGTPPGVTPADNDIISYNTYNLPCGTITLGKSGVAYGTDPCLCVGGACGTVPNWHGWVFGHFADIELHLSGACTDNSISSHVPSMPMARVGYVSGSTSPLTPASGSFGGSGQFQFSFSGNNGTTYDIQSSDDLQTWTHVANVTVSGTSGNFSDTSPGQMRFYKVVGPSDESGPFGFVKLVLSAGYSQIANPLLSGDMTIGTLLAGVPGGTTLSIWGMTGWSSTGWAETATYASGSWDHPDWFLVPGEGALINLPSAATITFIGEAVMGKITNAVPQGDSVCSSPVPQALHADSLGLTGLADGDYIQKLQGGTSSTYTRVSGAWQPEIPTVNVGEAIIVHTAGSAVSWNRLAPPASAPQAPSVTPSYYWDSSSGGYIIDSLIVTAAVAQDPPGKWRIYGGSEQGPEVMLVEISFGDVTASFDAWEQMDQGWMGYEGYYVSEVGNNVTFSGESPLSAFVPFEWWP